jgi:hypothetical protein
VYKFVLALVSTFFFAISPAAAKEFWVVTQLSGDARIVHGQTQPASLKVNAALVAGDLIITGPNGRATLSNEADYIVMAPRSELRLPAASQPSGFTRVIQNLGTMLFRVKHTGVPHFAVDTPMLAAVVKGTTFTIVVDNNRSVVQVTQGVVEVRANDGGMKALVEGGKTVFINRTDPKTIIDADSNPEKAKTTSPTAVKVTGTAPASLTTIASLTGGLVRPASQAQPSTAAPGPSSGTIPNVADADQASTPAGTASVVPAGSDAGVQTVETTAPSVAGAVVQPVVQSAETTVPSLTGPVAHTVETIVPVVQTITQPVADAVAPVVPTVTQPVVDTVAPVLQTVTQPVVDTVAPVVQTVTQPVVDTVAPVVQTVTQPVVDTVAPVVETVTQPVVDTVAPVVQTVTQPVVDTVAPVLQTVTQPVVDTVAPVLQTVTQPVVQTVTPVVQTITQPVQTILPKIPLLGPGL